jgi:membrane fusion protein, multidrug efflux system
MAADGGSTRLRPEARTLEPAAKELAAERREQAGNPSRTELSRKRLLRWALFLLLPIVLIAGLWFYVRSTRYVSTDDAYVEANTVSLSTDVSGIVTQVAVKDNQPVAKGQVLFRLDDLPYRLKLARARAELGTVRDDLDALKQNYLSVQAQISQAQANVAYDTRQFERQKVLAARQFASQEVLDQARRNLQTARDQLVSLRHQLDQIAAQLGGDPDLPITQEPKYRQTLAQRDEAARELRDTVVRAPYAGIVTNVPSLQPGMYLAAGTPAFAIVATKYAWIEAEPKETALTYVRPGQPAAVTVDAYPGREWHGTVATIAPAAESQFSLLPPENTSGNWVKVVQRIPMRVKIAAKPGRKPSLRAGMSAEVTVDTGRVHAVPGSLAWLFGKSRNG